jgi:four helix bundle protein
MDRFDLQKRLIAYSVIIIKIIKELPDNREGNHLAGQLIRSGTSPALNYGEAQSAESRRDFIHKMKISLKELRESLICLEIIYECQLHTNEETMILAKKESNELISIFVKSVNTAQHNVRAGKI